MSENLLNVKYLGNLANRVVRNAKPGSKNNPDAGLLYVHTDEPSDNMDPKEYLAQAYVGPNVTYLNNCVFTEGSKQVSTTSSLSGITPGLFIRPSVNGGVQYTITEVNGQVLTLDENFASESVTATAELQKLKFGGVLYQNLTNDLNSASSEFVYDKAKNEWVAEEGSSTGSTFATSIDGSAKAMEDGIYIHSLTNEDPAVPDMAITGVLDKYLPLTSTDTNMVSFTPVPNPSGLTAPVNNNNLKVWVKTPTDIDYRSLSFGEEFVVSYTPTPLFDGYRPLSAEVTNANLNLLEEFEIAQVIEEGFDGVLGLKSGDTSVTNIYEPSLWATKKIGTETTDLVNGKDFLVNSTTGTTVAIGFKEDESPVEQVLGFLDVFPNGFSVQHASVSLADATDEDFTSSPKLVEGADFSVNEKNGGFTFLKQVPPSTCVRVSYLVEGASQSKKLIIERASDLRLEYFPVMPNTVKVSSFRGKEVVPLTEGVDFRIFYSNGVLSLSEQTASASDYISVQYAPAVEVVCFASPNSNGSVDYKYKGIAVQVTSKRTFKILFDGSNISVSNLIDPNGSAISTTSISSKGNNVFDIGNDSTKMVTGSYILADVRVTADNLAYAPLVRIRKKLAKGLDSLVLEGYSTQSLGIQDNSLLLLRSSADPSLKEYSLVSSVTDLDGVNTSITLSNPLSVEVPFPSLYYTDSPITFSGLPSDVVIENFGTGAESLVFSNASNVPLRVGVLINLSSLQVVSVTGVSEKDGKKTVSISPNTRLSYDKLVSGVSVTTLPVYLEGDTGVLTESPVLSLEAPVAKLLDTSSPLQEIRNNISITSDKVVITRRQASLPDEEFILDLSNYANLKQLLDALVLVSLGEIGYEELRDTSKINISSLASTGVSFNPVQVPTNVNAYASLSRKIDGGPYIPLKKGLLPGQGDYNVVGGVIVLTDPLKQGYRFKVSYTHASNLGMSAGDLVTVGGRRFVAVPKNTSVRLAMDYLSQDQHLIQGTTESGFLGEYFYPYLSAMKKALKGQTSQGSRGVESSPSSGTSEGGVYNTFMQLRDHWLSSHISWKISDFYKYRMGVFSSEIEAVSGYRFGNNDFVNSDQDRMSKYSDVEQQSALGQSVFYPENYKQNTPKVDSRYGTSYTSYDQVIPFNKSGYGRLYGQHSDFNKNYRDIRVGDKIKLAGQASEYSVKSIDSATQLTLNELIQGVSEGIQPGLESNSGGFYGLDYQVLRSGRSWSYVDDKGCAGAVAVSPRQNQFFVFLEDTKKFIIEKSYDSGATWASQEVTIDTQDTIPLPQFLSLSEMAKLLYNKLYTEFIVRLETVYNFPGMSSEIEKALDISWPLPIPSTDDLPSSRSAIVIRSRSNNVWIRFNEVSGIDLGFPKNTVYESNYSSLNCLSSLSGETLFRSNESTSVGNIKAYPDKLTRGLQAPAGTLETITSGVVGYTSNHLASLVSAKQSTAEIMEEVEFDQAWQEASNASLVYDNLTTGTSSALQKDNSHLAIITSPSPNASINDLQVVTRGRDSVNSDLYDSWYNSGTPSVLFNSSRGPSYDGRVLLGDKSSNPSVLLGIADAIVSAFPFYSNNGDYLGPYSKDPLGYWGSASSMYGYSDGDSFYFHMREACTVTSTLLGASMYSDEYGITLDGGSGTTHRIDYGLYPTLAAFKLVVDAIPGFSVSLTHTDANVSFGLFVPLRYAQPLSTSPTPLVFGCRGDLNYYTISDYVFDDRLTALSSRASQLQPYDDFYYARKTQVETSFSVDGESLASNRENWLVNCLHKVYGPSNLILPLKKSLGGSV